MMIKLRTENASFTAHSSTFISCVWKVWNVYKCVISWFEVPTLTIDHARIYAIHLLAGNHWWSQWLRELLLWWSFGVVRRYHPWPIPLSIIIAQQKLRHYKCFRGTRKWKYMATSLFQPLILGREVGRGPVEDWRAHRNCYNRQEKTWWIKQKL